MPPSAPDSSAVSGAAGAAGAEGADSAEGADGAAGAAGAADAETPAVTLPEPVRARVVVLAADALGALTPEEVPRPLQAFRRFAPARRAKLAGTPIAAALERDEQFRQRVSDRLREAVPDLVAALSEGAVPAAADPVDVAAVAYVLRPPGWADVVAASGAQLRAAEQAARSSVRAEEVERLQAQLASARRSARAELDRVRAELAAARTEVADLRRRLHEAREARRTAQARAEEAEAAAESARSEAGTAVSAAEAELRRTRARLAEVEAALDGARQASRAGRALEDTRLRLLLDTVVEASQGLRRELALPPAAPEVPRPADVVGGVAPASPGVGTVAARAHGAEDPALLDQLLALPQVHLVIDGYNVTKSGYPALPLAGQRDRLVNGLAVLAARTGAEVTCCFDGADVDVPVVTAQPRGVRVLFSRPGEIADVLIRRLVRNEPPGRPVVVVTSDREVVDGVVAAGARAVPSAALVRRLDRA